MVLSQTSPVCSLSFGWPSNIWKRACKDQARSNQNFSFDKSKYKYFYSITQGLLGSAPLEVDIHKSDRNISQYLTVLQSVDVALLLEVTGHVPVSQLLISSSEPGHSVPPWDGGGSAQSRDLLCAPSPHVVLQELQLLHGDQLPSSCSSSPILIRLIQYNLDDFLPTIL